MLAGAEGEGIHLGEGRSGGEGARTKKKKMLLIFCLVVVSLNVVVLVTKNATLYCNW